jgi:rhodanese-related sulfurtransferase
MLVNELKERMATGDSFLFIDVREPYEYEEMNLGARLLPMGDLLQRISELEPYKDQEIVLHCQSGKRSAAVEETLRMMGFTKVCHLQGGILAWIETFGNDEIR